MAQQETTPPDSGSGSASASTGARSNSGATSLARGKACLRCRKRKMRCDGVHPACAQCVRAHKADACQYDDGRGKTRTQALRERIVRLEAELQRLRDGRGESLMGSPSGPEDSVFLMDPHAPIPPPSSSGSESTFGELDFVDFGADAFGPSSVPGAGVDIERPTTSLSDPSLSASVPAFTTEADSLDSAEYEGGVQRNRTIRPRDRFHTTGMGGIHEPRARPSSGVFGYSANHPLVQQAQAYDSPFQSPFQQAHSRESSTGSPSPSSSTVGSLGGHGQNIGASPYSSYADPLSLDPSPFPSPDPSMFTSTVPAFAAMRLERELGTGMNSETEATLIQLVIAHRDQFGLVLHPGRLLASLSSSSETHHPVLKDAITLVGAYLARRACGSAFVSASVEKALVVRTQAGINDALRLAMLPQRRASPLFQQSQPQPDGSPSLGQAQAHGQGSENCAAPALDALQAQVLLSRYLFAEGRMSEARIQVGGAADLVQQLGMHQLRAPNVSHEAGYESARPGSNLNDSVAGTLQLPLPSDSVALGERVALFWAVFLQDRMVSTALGLAPCIADDECVETRVDTPWPEEIEEYENIPMESIHGSATLRSFFINQGMQIAGASGGFAPSAIVAKAASLYSACARTSANWGVHSLASPPPAIFISSCTSPAPSQDQSADDPAMCFARLETCLARLASTLLPAHQLGAGLPDNERRKQIVLHTLIHASVARLHSRLARAGVGPSLEKSVRAARAAAALVRAHVVEKDYAVLDPLFAGCWSALAEVLSMEPVQASAATPGSPAASWVPQDHSTLLAALACLQGSRNSQTYSRMDSNSSSGT